MTAAAHGRRRRRPRPTSSGAPPSIRGAAAWWPPRRAPRDEHDQVAAERPVREEQGDRREQERGRLQRRVGRDVAGEHGGQDDGGRDGVRGQRPAARHQREADVDESLARRDGVGRTASGCRSATRRARSAAYGRFGTGNAASAIPVYRRPSRTACRLPFRWPGFQHDPRDHERQHQPGSLLHRHGQAHADGPRQAAGPRRSGERSQPTAAPISSGTNSVSVTPPTA